MNDSPLVSVIMPTYNSERFVSDSIESVIAQTFTEWELLITDDRSLDSTCSIVEEYCNQDHRVHLFCLTENSGAAVARNNSISKAKGRYVAFLDSDDIWLPEKLETQLEFMKEKNAGLSFTAYKTITEDDVPINTICVPPSLTYNQYLRNTIIGCLTVMVDRGIVGDFRMPLLRKRQDMATWLMILKSGVMGYGLNQPLSKYRIVASSISHNKLKAAKGVWKVYRDIEHLNFFEALKCFCGYGFNAIKKRMINKE